MKIILAWIVVSGAYYGGTEYSPPVATLEDCKRLEAAVKFTRQNATSTQCVQVNIIVPDSRAKQEVLK